MATPDDELVEVHRGDHCIVLMTRKVKAAHDKWDVNARATLLRVMQRLAEYGPAYLNEKQFRSEGRWRPAGAQIRVLIYAVKGWQVRLYGAFTEKSGNNRFICTEFDAAKKQNAADQGLLQSAANKLKPYL